jgi:hypothetical protein
MPDDVLPRGRDDEPNLFRIRRRRWPYYSAAGLAVLGAGAFLLAAGMTAWQAFGYDDHVIHLSAPLDGDVVLTEAGRYTIYAECDPDDPPDLRLELVSKATGRRIVLTPRPAVPGFDPFEEDDVAIAEFTIEQPGPYHLQARIADPEDDDPVPLRIVPDRKRFFLRGLVQLSVGAIVCLGAAVGALMLVLLPAWRRP